MDKIETLEDLETFKAKLDAAGTICAKEMKEFDVAYKANHNFLERFFLVGKYYKLMVNEINNIYAREFPTPIKVTPEVALFLAEDHDAFTTKASKLKDPTQSWRMLVGMVKLPLIVIFPSPLTVAGAAEHFVSMFKSIDEYNEKLAEINSQRNDLVKQVFSRHSLSKNQSGDYELRVGEYYYHPSYTREGSPSEGWMGIGSRANLEELRNIVKSKLDKSQGRT